MSDEKKNGPAREDTLILGPPTQDGGHVYVRHREDDAVEAGVCHPIPDGQPLGENAHLLVPRGNSEYTVKPVPESRKGPSRANSAAFVRNFDTIFGKKQVVGEA